MSLKRSPVKIPIITAEIKRLTNTDISSNQIAHPAVLVYELPLLFFSFGLPPFAAHPGRNTAPYGKTMGQNGTGAYFKSTIHILLATMVQWRGRK